MLQPSKFRNLSPDHLAVLAILEEANDPDPQAASTGKEYTTVLALANHGRPIQQHLGGPRVVSVLQTLQQRGLALRRGAGRWYRTEAGTRALEKKE